MKVVHYTDVPAQPMEDLPGITVRWVIGPADGAPRFAMRVFEVEPGRSSPQHAHREEHEIFILAGSGALWTPAGEKSLAPGVVAFVPPEQEHQFRNTGHEVLRFICVIPMGLDDC